MRFELDKLRVEISEEEILADLLYPHVAGAFSTHTDQKRPRLVQ